MGQGVIIKNKYYNGKIDITFPVLLSHLLIVLFTYFNFVYIYIYIYIYIYVYIFFFFFLSYKSQNILPKWEDLQSLDFILCLYAVSCIMYLFYVL